MVVNKANKRTTYISHIQEYPGLQNIYLPAIYLRILRRAALGNVEVFKKTEDTGGIACQLRFPLHHN